MHCKHFHIFSKKYQSILIVWAWRGHILTLCVRISFKTTYRLSFVIDALSIPIHRKHPFKNISQISWKNDSQVRRQIFSRYTTYIVMSITGWNFSLHSIMIFVSKGLKIYQFICHGITSPAKVYHVTSWYLKIIMWYFCYKDPTSLEG